MKLFTKAISALILICPIFSANSCGTETPVPEYGTIIIDHDDDIIRPLYGVTPFDTNSDSDTNKSVLNKNWYSGD